MMAAAILSPNNLERKEKNVKLNLSKGRVSY